MRSKEILKIAGIIFLCLLLLLIVFVNKAEADVPYKQVELPVTNSVANNTQKSGYDTAMIMALQVAGISGITVIIEDLSAQAKSQFNGELKAHVRYFNGQFYLFMAQADHRDAIEILSHEAVHIQQYLSGDLSYDDYTGNVIWKDRAYDLENVPYESRPWEMEAFSQQSSVSDKVTEILY